MDINKLYKSALKNYIVTNDWTDDTYKRYNTTANTVRHWVINHLDIGLNWTITEIK